MAIDFPDSPNVNDEFTSGDSTWIYDGTKWLIKAVNTPDNYIICTSSTRPGSPYSGLQIFETDTNKLFVYDGALWVEIADLDNEAGLPSDGAALSVLANGTNTAGARTDVAAGTDGHVLRRSGTALGFGTVATAGIANNAVTHGKFDTSLGIPLRTQSARGYYSNGATVTFASGRFTGTTVGVVVTPNTIGSALTFCITTIPSTSSFGIEFNNAAAGWLSWYAFSY